MQRFLCGVPVPEPRRVKSNNDTGMLKILACLLMLCDHMGKMIFPDAYVLHFTGPVLGYLPDCNILRAIGRLAMPMFAYSIAVGCNYTHNIWKYALRLMLMGILVHPLYQEAMGHVAFRKFSWQGDLPQNIYRLPLEIYRQHCPLFDESLYTAIDLKTCMEKRISEGGTSVASVEKQIAFVRKELKT